MLNITVSKILAKVIMRSLIRTPFLLVLVAIFSNIFIEISAIAAEQKVQINPAEETSKVTTEQQAALTSSKLVEQAKQKAAEETKKLAAEQQADQAAQLAAKQATQKAAEEKMKLVAEQQAELAARQAAQQTAQKLLKKK